VGINDILVKAIDRIDTLFNAGEAITGLSTGFTDLDEATSGLQPADLIIVAGRPSMGKTTFAMNLVENAVLRTDKAVLVFSLEMPATPLSFVCSPRSGVSTRPRSARASWMMTTGRG